MAIHVSLAVLTVISNLTQVYFLALDPTLIFFVTSSHDWVPHTFFTPDTHLTVLFVSPTQFAFSVFSSLFSLSVHSWQSLNPLFIPLLTSISPSNLTHKSGWQTPSLHHLHTPSFKPMHLRWDQPLHISQHSISSVISTSTSLCRSFHCSFHCPPRHALCRSLHHSAFSPPP